MPEQFLSKTSHHRSLASSDALATFTHFNFLSFRIQQGLHDAAAAEEKHREVVSALHQELERQQQNQHLREQQMQQQLEAVTEDLIEVRKLYDSEPARLRRLLEDKQKEAK